MQHATAASDVAPGARFRYGTRVFAVESVPPDGNSLFQAVLNSGLLPGMTVQKLRAGLLEFSTGAGRPLAQLLMTLFSQNSKVNFDEYVKKKLGTLGVEGDNFEVVLLAVLLRINLVVFKQSSAGIAVFNARYFLLHEVRTGQFEIPAASEIYLFQRQFHFGVNNAICNQFLLLRLIMDLKVQQDGLRTGRSRLTVPASLSTIPLKLPRPAQTTAQAVAAKVVENATANRQNQNSRPPTTASDFVKLQKISELVGQLKSNARKQQSDVKIFNVEIGSDFRLLVDKDAFFVHRNILSEECGTFRKFFDSKLYTKQLQNSSWNGRDIIVKLPRPDAVSSVGFGELADHPSAMFRQFLELMYELVAIRKFSISNIAYITSIASKMECERILQICDQELSKRLATFQPERLTFSRRFRLQRFRKTQLALFDSQVINNFDIISKVSEQDLSDYFEAALKRSPVTLMTVALIYFCGLDDKNSIRKRGDFYEISRRLGTCRKWVALFARRSKNTKDLTELYALVSRARLVHFDGRYDDVALRDTLMLALSQNITSPKSNVQNQS